jgi:hypothetical protein
MIQVYELKKLNSVLNPEINIVVFVGHIHLNKFLINFSSPRITGWVCNFILCLMVIVCTSMFIS